MFWRRILFVLLASAALLKAQPLPNTWNHEQLGTVAFLQLERPVSVESWPVLAQKLGAAQGSTWREISRFTDELGQEHIRLQQVVSGADVYFGEAILHLRSGQIFRVNGALVPASLLSSDPVKNLRDQQADLKRYLDQQPVGRWAWEDEGLTRLFQQVQGRKDTSFYPQGKMVWYAPVNRLDQVHRMAYQYKVYAADTAWAREVFLDAGTGALLGEHELIHHTDVTGKAKTKYSDTQSMVTDSTGASQYRLREAGRGNGIETYDMNNGTNYNSAVDFTDADNFWNNVNAQKDEVAPDAHWGAQMTFDYFKKEHNRSSYDNNNAKIYSFVHYSSNYNNAFWNGWCMTYGDGNGSTFTPLTAIDVCGHEIAHAVTSNTANLVYSYESGALNESFSDIFGNAVEQYGRPNDWSWRIGEDMTPSGNGIRAMENPNLFNQPKFYKGVKWYSGTGDNGGVHYNSGVQNYWFYLLSEGVSGTNEKGWSFSIDSLGMEEAGKIAYRNLSVYLTKSAQHADARTYSIMSATDLYGNCSPEVISVTNAWWVCGVGGKYDSTYVKANFRSDTLVCRTGQSVQFANKSENFISLTWYFGDGSTSSALNPTHAYSNYGTYDVSLKAVACSGTDTDSIFMAGQVQVDSMADLCFGVFMPESGRDTASRCFGYIYDDGADGTYNPNRNTALVLQIPGADSLRFRLLFCDYESGYDSLVLFKNDESWANKLGRLTGTNPTLQGKAVGSWHQFAGNTLILKNYTDPAVEGAGFKIEFEGIRPQLSVSLQPSADTLICYGDSVLLKAIGKGGWAPDFLHYWNGVRGSSQKWVRPLSDSNFVLRLRDACSWNEVLDTVLVQVREPLSISLVPSDSVLCLGQSLSLKATASGGLASGYSYTWNPAVGSGASVSVSPSVSTSYQVVLQDGCTDQPDTASVWVWVKPGLNILGPNDTLVCISQSASCLFGASGGDTAGFSWSYWALPVGAVPSGLGSSFAGVSLSVLESVSDTLVLWARLEDGCSVASAWDTAVIYTYPALSGQVSSDTAICVGSSLDLSVLPSGGLGSGYSVTWTGGLSGLSVSVLPNSPFVYSVVLSDGCSPDWRDSVRVDWLAPLSMQAIADTTLCWGQRYDVDVAPAGGRQASWKMAWIPGGPGAAQQSLRPASSGTWNYSVIFSDGCTVKSDTQSFQITVRDSLWARIDFNPSLLCQGDTVKAQIFIGGGDTANYAWQLNGKTAAALSKTWVPSASEVWSFQLSDNCSASANASASLTVNPSPSATFTYSATSVCEGDSIVVQAAGQNLYNWRLWAIHGSDNTFTYGGPTQGDTLVMKPSRAGTHSLVAVLRSPAGCLDTLALPQALNWVAYPEAAFSIIPNIALSNDPLVISTWDPGVELVNKTPAWDQLDWSISDGSTYQGPNVQHSFSDTGLFGIWLVASSDPGCVDSAYRELRVRQLYQLYLPSSFTPNSDGLNDGWKPVGTGIAEWSFTVYNRLGQRLFESDALAGAWTGMYQNGDPCPQGSYLLVVKVVDFQGQSHEEMQLVHLLR